MGRRAQDGRYINTERRILGALKKYIKENPYTIGIKMKKLARESGIHPATAYRHYKGAEEALFLYGKQILVSFRRRAGGLRKNGAGFADLIYFLVRFVKENRDFFEMSFCCGDLRVFEKMLLEIDLEVVSFAQVTILEMQRVREVYYGEIYGVLNRWRKNSFRDDEMLVKKDIVFLTKNMRGRLGEIGKK